MYRKHLKSPSEALVQRLSSIRVGPFQGTRLLDDEKGCRSLFICVVIRHLEIPRCDRRGPKVESELIVREVSKIWTVALESEKPEKRSGDGYG